jgi:hypothetical protein
MSEEIAELARRKRDQLGTLTRRWKTRPRCTDSGVCEQCEQYDKVEVEENQDFPEGDPPLHPHCCCEIQIVFKGF